MASMVGPKMKLARSREHWGFLSKEMQAFAKTKPPAPPEARKTRDGAYVARFKCPTPPDYLGIIAADFFQNLRASLDYLAWELALANITEGFPFNRTEFPICTDWEPNTRHRFQTATQNLCEDAKNTIQALQPYHREGDSFKVHPLRVLDFFCNIAKHRTIPMTGTCVKIEGMIPEYEVFDDGTIELIFPPPLAEDFKPDVTFSVTFGGHREFEGISLQPHEVAVLYNFVAEAVFPRFDRFFPITREPLQK